MTPLRELIAIAIALATLAVVVFFLALVSMALLSGTLVGNAFPGSAYLAVMESAEDIRSVFTIAILVITAGINLLGRASTKPWMILTSCALCLIGLACCFGLLVGLKDPDVARPIWSMADTLTNYEALQQGNRRLIELLAAWLGTFLATQLGIAIAQGKRRDQPAGRDELEPRPPADQEGANAPA